MKNTFGNNISVTIFGESHGPAVGVVIDGLAPGLEIKEDKIRKHLERRRPSMATDTARREPDEFSIISGVFNGKTCGTPLTIIIPNKDTKSGDYKYGVARPSHSDYTAFCKYNGFEDYRGGGHFSGRVTAALAAAGGILIPVLAEKGILIGTHIAKCGGVEDRSWMNMESDIEELSEKKFPVLDDAAGEKMCHAIMAAAEDGDSLGGVTRTAIKGLPAGLGEPWFDSVEGMLSHALFSIGGIKGIEFGEAWAMTEMRGSEANDPLRENNGVVYTTSNRNGGINGGITNGMPVTFSCAIKPTPSISKEQMSVNFLTGRNESIRIEGRHDPAIIRRICPVIDSVAAIVLCDMLAGRFGTDYLACRQKREETDPLFSVRIP